MDAPGDSWTVPTTSAVELSGVSATNQVLDRSLGITCLYFRNTAWQQCTNASPPSGGEHPSSVSSERSNLIHLEVVNRLLDSAWWLRKPTVLCR